MTAEIYYRRLLWLLLFGVIHAYILLWPGEILYGYALFGMMLFPIRKWSAKWLIIGAAILTLIGTALNTYKYSGKMDKKAKFELAQNYTEADMPEDVKEGKEAWEGIIAEMKPSQEKIQEETVSMHGNYFELLVFLAPYNRYMQTEFIYDVYTWDVLVMMLLGMAFFRMRIITAEHSYRYYALMMIIGYAILILSGLLLMSPYWPTLLDETLLTAKLVLVLLLGAFIGMASASMRRAVDKSEVKHLDRLVTIGPLSLLTGISIVILSVLIFH